MIWWWWIRPLRAPAGVQIIVIVMQTLSWFATSGLGACDVIEPIPKRRIRKSFAGLPSIRFSRRRGYFILNYHSPGWCWCLTLLRFSLRAVPALSFIIMCGWWWCTICREQKENKNRPVLIESDSNNINQLVAFVLFAMESLSTWFPRRIRTDSKIP